MWLEVPLLVSNSVVGVLAPEDGKGGPPLIEGSQVSEITSPYNWSQKSTSLITASRGQPIGQGQKLYPLGLSLAAALVWRSPHSKLDWYIANTRP